MDYQYKKSGAIFNAHSYWTKQPVDVVRKFIRKNTLEGDIVLDPFCGTGMTGVAAIMENRHFLLSDISPICVHIAKGYCTKIDNIDEKDIIRQLSQGITELYETECPQCGSICNIDYSILEDNLENKNELTCKKIVFHCDKCGKKIVKTPSPSDIEKQNHNGYDKFYYPKADFFGQEPQRNYKKGIRKVYQLYSNRNLTALAILLNNIKNIQNKDVRSLCLFAFTSIVFNCSIMSRYNPKYENTQIRMGTFYIPKNIKDNNVLSSYSRKLKSVIKSNKEIFYLNQERYGNIAIMDATNLSEIQSKSVDYIYTDPPYSDKISYSELNIVYESWLGKKYTDVSAEMIVSKSHNKSIENYSALFSKFLSEAYRVLKVNGRITIIFHNSNITHWKSFQQIVNNSGFCPIKTEKPERLISDSKTSTQYQASNISKCFMAFTLEKQATPCANRLKYLDKEEYIEKIGSIKKAAKEAGYKSNTDIYDYVINGLFYDYNFREDVDLF